jgi:hypothetical protein
MKRFIAFILALASLYGGLVAQNLRPREDAKFLKKAALQIDQQIAAFYRSKNLAVPPVTDDATFLRRAFLVAIGRIPTAEETIAFLEIQDTDKREVLINYLLKSGGFSSHMANWAFDLLRVTDGGIDTGANNEPYRHWVRAAMTTSMPWNEFTHHLIASSGDGWDPKTAAVGYYTRDRGMPLDNLSNTMRVFLGSHMECAQCHDDPYGKTERHDFYQLAAFTHGQDTVGQELMGPLWNELREAKGGQSEEYRIGQVLWDRVYGMSLGGGGTGQIQLPADYQYHDAKPGDLVGAETPFGQKVHISKTRMRSDGREKLAEWIVAKTGEQFSSVIANRMWKRVMGKGIYEPVDEFIPANQTNSPELIDCIKKLMVDLDYDLRAFQHVLFLTRTFQFSTNPNPSSIQGGDDFHGRKIERLSAEQIWDSLVTLAVGDPDQKAPRALDDRIYVGNRPVLVGQKNMSQLSKEVLALKSEPELRSYFANLVKKINAGSASNQETMMAMSSTPSYNKDDKVRSSELPSPAPRDHFLYLFGASDREVVEASSREPNVGQVLSLMNGFVQRELVNKSTAHLYKSLVGTNAASEKIRRLYIAILSRPPTDEEMSWMVDEVNKQGDAGCRNIVSALVMSSEFLFLQ